MMIYRLYRYKSITICRCYRIYKTIISRAGTILVPALVRLRDLRDGQGLSFLAHVSSLVVASVRHLVARRSRICCRVW